MTRIVAAPDPNTVTPESESAEKLAKTSKVRPTKAQARKIRATFGKNLRVRRLARGLSQEALALESGIDRTFLSQIERGIRQPSLTSLCRMAGALHTTVKELVNCIDEEFGSR